MDRMEIYRRLFDRVVSGEYPQGQRLREDALAADFGTSRTPVREALLLLEQDGLARSTPNRGFTSMGFTVDDLEEAYEIRRVLEILALDRAIKTLSLQDLRAVRRRVQEVADSGDTLEHAEVDSALHRLIVSSSKSPRLIHMLSSLFRIMRTFRELGFEDPELRRLAGGEHLMLIDALLTRDGDAAAAVLDQHIRKSKSRALRRIVAGDTIEVAATEGM
jgi:DNA-binding GntR family transcriptional regulator